jgi:hypothetical protein
MNDTAAIVKRLGAVAGWVCLAFTLGACSHYTGKGAGGVSNEVEKPNGSPHQVVGATPVESPDEGGRIGRGPDRDIEDLMRIPQKIEALPAVANGGIGLDEGCRSQLLASFERHFFSPWTSKRPLSNLQDAKTYMQRTARGTWYGVNKRKVTGDFLRRLIANCDLEGFPCRFDAAIAVAPGHLRGLPTPLPIYERADDEPFDMLAYPQVKLNEPLRVLHESGDGAWLFVETATSNGWLERRDVALVDEKLIGQWRNSRRLVVVQDNGPVSDGRGIATFPAKIGTILPLVSEDAEGWQVAVAAAGDGGMATATVTRLPRESARPFPLGFTGANVALIGNQMLGHPYGWGEIYGLRDCSALLRDFFMPFGIWMPRTAIDQISSLPERFDLSGVAAAEKEELIKSRGVPFLTLLYKRGHIMLYVGLGRDGRPLAFHDSWSIKVQDGDRARKQITGVSAITTLEPGAEIGLAPGESLLERLTSMGTVLKRCSNGQAGSMPYQIPKEKSQ